MVLYAAGITYKGAASPHPFAVHGEDYLTAADKLNRSQTESMGTASDGTQYYRGGANFANNSTVFEKVSGNVPVVGSFGMSRDANNNYTDHVYVVIGINNDGTLQIAQSSGGKGVNLVKSYNYNVWRNDTFYQVRSTFNPGGMR